MPPTPDALRDLALLRRVRDRIDRGLADQRTYQLHAEEAYWLTATRAQAPVLQWLTNYRAV